MADSGGRLLETGSTNLIRNTAAQQLADVQKQHPDELFNLLTRVIPFLRSSKWDTRVAAAKALGGIVENAPRFDPNAGEVECKSGNGVKIENGDNAFKMRPNEEQLQLETLDIASVLKWGKKLLGSAGKEHDYALAALDPTERLALQKSTLNSRLGLRGEYIENDGPNEKDILPTPQTGSFPLHTPSRADTNPTQFSRQNSLQSPLPMTADLRRDSLSQAPNDDSGLSKRQLNALKRKNKMNAKNQAGKVRVVDFSAHRQNSIIPQTPLTPEPSFGTTDVKREGSADIRAELFSLDRAGTDDDSKVVSEFKGIAISEKSTIQTEAEEEGLEWPFERLCNILSVDLFDHNWEIRHGAAMGLREVVRVHGAGAGRLCGESSTVNDELNSKWLNNLACRYCCVLMLDRFGDYVSDNVVAPIRETVGQTLATLLVHLSPSVVRAVYHVLHRMVLQSEPVVSGRIWEVCHGGMIGLKYLVVVRKDLLMQEYKLLDGVVEAVMKGLADSDDDVRAVSAATLTPIAEDFVKLCPNLLPTLVSIVWECLSDLRDDLSASTGHVMDLLATLCNHPQVLQVMTSNARNDSHFSFTNLVPRLYHFLRHTITSVRSAVLRALQTFLRIEDAGTKGWIDGRLLRLIFQNLLVERNEVTLELSLEVWNTISGFLDDQNRFGAEFLPQSSDLMQLALHPIGVSRHPIPMNINLIMRPSGQMCVANNPVPHKSSPQRIGEPPAKRRRRSEKKEEPPSTTHNVDGHMLQGDVDLVGAETLIRSRIYASRAFGKALGICLSKGQGGRVMESINHALCSTYSTTQMAAAMIIEEHARCSKNQILLPNEFMSNLHTIVELDRPDSYTDLTSFLQVVRAQCHSLLNAFRDHGHVPPSKIPTIAVIVQGEPGAGPSAFAIANADTIVNQDFERLKKSLTPTHRVTSLTFLNEARINAVTAIEEAKKVKIERDIRIKAAASGAMVALLDIPKKPSHVIKGLMDSIKAEENVELQRRSALSISFLVRHYSESSRRGPADKIIGNLVKFYCIDTSETPEFAPNASLKQSILSLRKEEDRREHPDAAKYEAEARAARITRRGAKEAFDQLNRMFGDNLFVRAPTFVSKIQGPLEQAFKGDLPSNLSEDSHELGQDIVDAFSILRALVPNLSVGLYNFVEKMMPMVLKALSCEFSVFRYAAAKCFATMCSVMTVKAMTMLVERVLPAISNPLDVARRQGAIECAYHLIHVMEDSILSYVVFLIVPILGRMSDSDSDVRLIATTTFATLVKLVPLEAGIPDPPGFSEELLKGRDKERKFVAQMLDPKKTEPFEIPVAIKAQLRSYQQEGVNWLAFLNKFNLHGVLCDDMGLGKTLQTLCIVASDHHMRAVEFAKTKALDSRRLPSLIVCPPTLSGHWQQEIQTYAPFLTCLAYVGPPADRSRLRASLEKADVVVTSYDVCRNDVDILAPLNWNYCVLDEGHLIKNPRAKTTIAVKRISSNHRLILSGTPIQNNVLELWSLFDFLMPGFLGTEKLFQERFAKPIAASRYAKSSSKEQEKGALAIESLHKQVLPFLLRRLKEEVLDDLPPKILQNYYCDMSELQKQLHVDFTKKEGKHLAEKVGSSEKEAKQHVFQAIQYMKKLLNSPSLVVKEGHKQYEAIQKRLAAQNSSLKDIAHAPKLTALRDLLVDCGIGVDAPSNGELGAETNYVSQHRALIFCQMKEMLDIVQNDVLKKLLPSVQFLRLDGGVEANKRQTIVNQFNSDPSYDVLLLTTSVGGLGLNLTGADTVIFVEHDWNPQKDLQAMDRAHRIGQKKVVNVYRLITRGTLEEKILK